LGRLRAGAGLASGAGTTLLMTLSQEREKAKSTGQHHSNFQYRTSP
jgi:hypothetical protein